MTIKADNVQIGQNATATQNFVLKQGADGTCTLARGNVGATTQDVLTVDASGNVNAPVAMQQGGIAMGRMVLSTAQATTSGTSIDFTGIPSWAKRITVMLNEVSISGTSDLLVQLGDSGGIEATNYICSWGLNDVAGAGGSSTSGYFIRAGAGTVLISGAVTLLNITGNIWVGTSTAKIGSSAVCISVGTKTLSDILTQIRMTTVNGTDTFDAGSVNIMYEG